MRTRSFGPMAAAAAGIEGRQPAVQRRTPLARRLGLQPGAQRRIAPRRVGQAVQQRSQVEPGPARHDGEPPTPDDARDGRVGERAPAQRVHPLPRLGDVEQVVRGGRPLLGASAWRCRRRARGRPAASRRSPPPRRGAARGRSASAVFPEAVGPAMQRREIRPAPHPGPRPRRGRGGSGRGQRTVNLAARSASASGVSSRVARSFNFTCPLASSFPPRTTA